MIGLDRAVPLDDKTLLMFDEADMVGTRNMEAVLTAARDAGAKVVLAAIVGSLPQLPAPEPSGPSPIWSPGPPS